MQFDRQLVEWSCKRALYDAVTQSKTIHEKLSFEEQVKMVEWIGAMTYEESVSAVFYNSEPLNEIGIRQFESKFKAFIKYGLAAIAGGVLAKGPLGRMVKGPAVAMFAYYLFRKMTDPCWQVCLKRFGQSKERKVCRYECQVKAAKNIIRDIRGEMNRCGDSRNPIKCEKKLNKLLVKWSKKLEKQLVKLQNARANLIASKRPAAAPEEG